MRAMRVIGQHRMRTDKVKTVDRGRDAHYWAPPAQNRTGPIKASGSKLGYLTAKRARGHGWRMRGVGSHRSRIERIFRQEVRSFWLRRRSARIQSSPTRCWKLLMAAMLVGTAW